ncbi:MAG: T9SS type A sorting domain-containing protein [Crocinitomicaceae bacterium]|nr:T9SS type A sorting domain-containing protein [Crocinitomicaceae bacterium]
MKSYLTILIILLSANFCQSQTVQSSCFAPDSVKALYMVDAKRLALRKIFEENLTYKDSIHIPQSHSDTVMNALIAVKNATSIPEADSLTGGYYFVHTTQPPTLDKIVVKADSSLAWMDSLSIGVIPTGDNYIDSLINTHYLSLSFFNSFSYNAGFETDSNYNISALADAFMEAPLVYLAQENPYPWPDPADIKDTIYPDHVQLTYSIGFNCFMGGCDYYRYWIFKVYYDCSVEFVDSYNTSPWTGMDITEDWMDQIQIYPNPVSNSLTVGATIADGDIASVDIINLQGQIIESKDMNFSSIISSKVNFDVSHLPEGLYVLKFNINGVSYYERFIKK